MSDPTTQNGKKNKTDPSHRIPPDQAERQMILCRLDQNCLVEAAAGTGKTTSMVGRMVSLIRSGTCKNIRNIAAVTFTRKAAAELRVRFQLNLEQAVREATGSEKEALALALTQIEQCFVGTIHSFCARMLRERPVEANVDVSFQELDEDADKLLRKQAWDEFCAGLVLDDPAGVLPELAKFGLELKNLEAAWMAFAEYPDVDEWPQPASAGELPAIKEAGRKVTQFVNHMDRLFPRLPDEWGSDRLIPEYRRLPRVIAHYEDLSQPSQLMDFLGFFEKEGKVTQKFWTGAGFTKEEALAEKDRWNRLREDTVLPLLGAWRELRYGPIMRILSLARSRYNALRQSQGRLNYQDLLLRAAALLRDHPHVRKYFQDRFQSLLVDEFQDTDPIQAEVMLLLTATDLKEPDWRKCQPRAGSLFVVGDPKQSIYRFRRADIVTYNEVKEIIRKGNSPDKEGIVLQLSANFRTSEPVIHWINDVFKPEASEEKSPKQPPATGPMLRFPNQTSNESPDYVVLQAGREDGNQGKLTGIHVLRIPGQYTDKLDAVDFEADRIARTIRHALDTGMTVSRTRQQIERGKPREVDPSDFLIVTMKTEHLGRYGQKLQEYDIPHRVTGGSALNAVRELSLLRNCLHAVIRPEDPVALVGALRSELFGFSDQDLYIFAKLGGLFSYREEVPGGVPVEKEGAESCIERFYESFQKLRTYARWISSLPVISALERIVADLGLMAMAANRPTGDVEAGSLAKALELIRTVERESWSNHQILEYLDKLVSGDQTHDGISVLSQEVPSVRIMNLHKVKGLEAPVVFLACPLGEFAHPVKLHIDRTGGKVLGFMGIEGEKRGKGPAPVLAHPEDWEEFREKEKAYERAEDLRLRYVAATRAGGALIITQRMGKGNLNRFNPWHYFAPYLPADQELFDPDQPSPGPSHEGHIESDEFELAMEALGTRMKKVQTPTYDLRGAKELAMDTNDKNFDPIGSPVNNAAIVPAVERVNSTPAMTTATGEHGVEWGEVIHQLLEIAMKNPKADLLRLADVILAEHGLDAEHTLEAVEEVRAVTHSEIWKRASKSVRKFTEIPFQVLTDDGEHSEVPTLLRGMIDLVFLENDGWVIVDYKTDNIKGSRLKDLATKYGPQVRLYANAWEKCTGDKVKETGLYFLKQNKFHRVCN